MNAQRTPAPKRTVPDPDDVYLYTGAALHRFMGKYGLTQKWVAETIDLSQPQVSYLLGRSQRERPRELQPSECLRLELRVRAEIDPDLVLGEILRDTGIVEEVAHPADVVRAYPFLTPRIREDIAVLIVTNEARFREDFPDEPEAPARLVRSEPQPRRGSTAAAPPARARKR